MSLSSQWLDWTSRLITARPWVTLAVLAIITVGLGAGIGQRAPLAESITFLPRESDVAKAMDDIEELFEHSEGFTAVTLVLRGNVFTPSGLAQIDRLLTSIVNEPGVAELLAHSPHVAAPTLPMAHLLDVNSFDSVTQAQIDAALQRIRAAPELGPHRAELAAMTGTDADGGPIAVAVVWLHDTGDEDVEQAQWKIHELAEADRGSLRVRSVSPAVIEKAYIKATGPDMMPLVGVAILVVAAVLLVFMRSLLDLLLILGGLVLVPIWTLGAEGWLGPAALGVIGPPNALGAMVPIILIGLAVDYSIQAISHYREQRGAGQPVAEAIRDGLRGVIIPVTLAAGTTVACLLTSLLSPIAPVGDFGVVAGLGVGFSPIVMLTFIPAARAIIDRRREARGSLPPARPVAGALPGVERGAEKLAALIVRWPAPFLILVAAVTIGMGFAARDISTDFSIRDFLPRDGVLSRDLATLDTAVGGSTEVVSVLVKAEATETHTILNVLDFTIAFDDERRRPRGAASSIYASPGHLVADWTTDSGEPGDKYDPEMEALFSQATAGLQVDQNLIQQVVDNIRELDTHAISDVMVNDPDGVDTLLLQFQAYSGDPQRTRWMQEDIKGIWFGKDNAIIATSPEIITLAITDEIRASQTETTLASIAAALCILTFFFWLTLRQPALGLIAIGPVAVVLIWVLGTMALLGIPYTIATSAVTALSIGISVDYAIHIIHRYQEEYLRRRDPEQAAARTLATTGSALLGSGLTTALGVAVLMLSPLLAFQQFGIMVALTIAYSLVVSVLMIPPAMTIWGAYRNMRLRSMVKRLWEELDEIIEDPQQPR